MLMVQAAPRPPPQPTDNSNAIIQWLAITIKSYVADPVLQREACVYR